VRRAPSHLAAGLLTATEPVVALGSRRKCTLLAESAPAGPVRDESRPAGGPRLLG
jgi:hypothetical protein